jgi:hypothetical protein
VSLLVAGARGEKPGDFPSSIRNDGKIRKVWELLRIIRKLSKSCQAFNELPLL